MKKHDVFKADLCNLRHKAEKLLKNNASKTGSQFSEIELLKILHELEVHKIELEMQNEDLKVAKEQLEVSSRKYLELYDLAPSGYFTLSKEGKIMDLNLSGSQMLGKEVLYVKNTPFDFFVTIDSKPIFNHFLRKIFSGKEKETCEIALAVNDNLPRYMYLTGIVTDNGEHCLLTAIDITERKRTEEALKESEKQRINTVLKTAMDGFIMADLQGRILEVNETYCQMSGYSLQELLTMHITDLEATEAAEHTAARIEKIFIHGKDRFETRHRRKDGSIIDVEISVQYMNSSGGQFVAFQHDITSRKHAEELLIESEHRYRSLFEDSNDAIFLIDLNSGRYIDCNRMAESLTGFTHEEILLMKTGAFLPPHRKGELTSIREALLSGNVLRRETEIITRGGELIPVEFNTSLVTINKKQCILSMLHDISERRATEEALRKSEESLKKAQEIAHLGSWSLDLVKDILTWSDEMYRIFDVQRHEFSATYEGFLELVHPDDRDAVNSAYSNSISEGKDSYEIEHRIFCRHTGELRQVLEKCEHIRDNSGKIICSVGMTHDITERKQSEESVRENERLFRESQSVAHIGSYKTDLVAKTWMGTPETDKILGIDKTYPHTLEGLIGLIHPESRKELFGYNMKLKTEKKGFDHEFQIVRFNDGEERWVHGLGELEFDNQTHPVRIIGTLRDITRRKQTELALKRLNEELEERVRERTTELLNVTVEIEERERNRFSRELHDGLGPLLSTVKLYFQWLSETNNAEKVKIITKKGNDYIERAIQTTHEVALGLNSVILNNLGYVDTIFNFIQNINELQILSINFTFNSNIRFNYLLESSLYRITTELINNTIKYARASHVDIAFNYQKTQNRIVLTYIDNGTGFDLSDTLKKSKGLGLMNIQQRIKIIQGKIEIETGIGKGMKVYIEFPVDESLN